MPRRVSTFKGKFERFVSESETRMDKAVFRFVQSKPVVWIRKVVNKIAPKSPRVRKALPVMIGLSALIGTAAVMAVGQFDPVFAQGANLDTANTATSSEAAKVIVGIIAEILFWINAFLGSLATTMFSILVWAFSWNEVLDVEAVQTGWGIVRDFANMFFIVVLLLIAFGTILRIEQYNYRKLLPGFVIMAILINFTQVFAGIFIDLSNIIMFTFTDKISNATGPGLISAFGLPRYSQITEGTQANSIFTILTAGFLSSMFLVMIIAVTAIYALILVFRTVALWLLVILSPLAFLGYTFPQGRKFWSQWWSEFGKYIMVGPMLMFFLWLALLISTGTGQEQDAVNAGGSDIAVVDLPVSSSEAVKTPDIIIKFIVSMTLLVAGLKFSADLGTMGAGVMRSASASLPAAAAGIASLGAAGTLAGYAKGTYKGFQDRRAKSTSDSNARWEQTGARFGNFLDTNLQPAITEGQRKDKRARISTFQQGEIELAAKSKRTGSASTDQLRVLSGSSDASVRAASIQELAKRKSLRPADVESINDTIADLTGEVKESFKESIIKGSPAAAMLSSIYRDSGGTVDPARLFADINKGTVSGGAIGKAFNDPAVARAWGGSSGKDFLDMVEDTEQLTQMYNKLSTAQQSAMFGTLGSADYTDAAGVFDAQGAGKAAMVTGRVSAMFSGQSGAMTAWAQANKEAFEKALKNQPTNARDPEVMRAAREALGTEGLGELAKNRAVRAEMGTGMAAVISDVNSSATPFDGNANELRRINLVVSGNIGASFNGNNAEFISALNSGAVSSSDIARVDAATVSPAVLTAIASNMLADDVKKVLNEGNKALARRIVGEMRAANPAVHGAVGRSEWGAGL